MSFSSKAVRHVICGLDQQGQSAVVYDGPDCKVLDFPGQSVSVLWSSSSVPASNNSGAHGSMAAHYAVLAQAMMPAAGGFTFLRCERLPEVEIAAPMAAMDRAKHAQDDATFMARPDLHPGMHATHTLDLHVVVSGELTLILEAETVTLRAGESMVMRGVQHAWENRGNVPVVWYCVVVDAVPLDAITTLTHAGFDVGVDSI